MADVRDERPTRKRKSGPKSRSGCKTCKIRHVKCDETKPFCIRCRQFGSRCDGYSFVPETPRERELRSKDASQNISATALNSSAKHSLRVSRPVAHGSPVPGQRPMRMLAPAKALGELKLQSDLEYQYFSLFQSTTAAEICGDFDNDVWNRLILQACHQEEYALRGVIAIGALQKTLLARDLSDAIMPAAGHYAFALHQYGISLRLMQGFQSLDDVARLRNTLISSLLTTCFETFNGNQEHALTQAQAGVDVLFEWQESHTTSASSSSSPSFLDNDILGAFARLDVMVMTFKDLRLRRQPSQKGATVQYPFIPAVFESVKEARLVWDMMIQVTMHWRADCLQDTAEFTTLDFGDGHQLSDVIEVRESMQAEIELFTNSFAQWEAAFLPVFNQARKKPRTKDFLGATTLMLKRLSQQFSVASVWGDESSGDAFHNEYILGVSLARDILEAEGRRLPGKATFTFDESTSIALYVIAIRCREGQIRREAISLLWKYPRREGLWDSTMAAKLATWIMNTEEQDMVDGFVPVTARLKIVNNDFVLAERKAMVKCSKMMEKSNKRVLLPEVTLTW